MVDVTQSPVLDAATATASGELVQAPEFSRTRTAAALLSQETDALRTQTRVLHEDTSKLHQGVLNVEWRGRTAELARSSTQALLEQVNRLGFSWRDVARLVGVSVPGLHRWRRGESATGVNHERVARLVAVCELIAEKYPIDDVASWFEVPIVGGVPVTCIDLYEADRSDLVLDFASMQGGDPHEILDSFDPEWRTRYESDLEVVVGDDGLPTIRHRDGRNV